MQTNFVIHASQPTTPSCAPKLACKQSHFIFTTRATLTTTTTSTSNRNRSATVTPEAMEETKADAPPARTDPDASDKRPKLSEAQKQKAKETAPLFADPRLNSSTGAALTASLGQTLTRLLPKAPLPEELRGAAADE